MALNAQKCIKMKSACELSHPKAGDTKVCSLKSLKTTLIKSLLYFLVVEQVNLKPCKSIVNAWIKNELVTKKATETVLRKLQEI